MREKRWQFAHFLGCYCAHLKFNVRIQFPLNCFAIVICMQMRLQVLVFYVHLVECAKHI